MDTSPGWSSFCLLPSCAQKRADLSPNNLELHQQLISKHCCRAQKPAEMCFETSQKKKNHWKDGFGSFCLWVELSWSWSWWDLGEKHSLQEVFVLINSLFATCKAEGAMRMVLKLFVTLEGGKEKKLDLIVSDYSFYSLCILHYSM